MFFPFYLPFWNDCRRKKDEIPDELDTGDGIDKKGKEIKILIKFYVHCIILVGERLGRVLWRQNISTLRWKITN